LALLTHGFRPFFLAAGTWSATALGVWVALFAGAGKLPSRFDPLAWHIHEMIFGFALAVVAGFLLTAIPNWTARPPLSGVPLAGLAFLWLVARLACLVSALLPGALAVAADLAFPTALAAVTVREIVAGRNWRNLAIAAPVTLLGIADLLMQLEMVGVAVPAGLGWRLGLGAVLVLISVVGGRIIPSFTRNWLERRRHARLPAAAGRIDRVALGLLHLGLSSGRCRPISVRPASSCCSAPRPISGASRVGEALPPAPSRCFSSSTSVTPGSLPEPHCSAPRRSASAPAPTRRSMR
jgi:uncharacterized protein involved in response to NO